MNQLVLDIARRANVRKVIKSKSMLGEESGLNHFLEQGGIEVRETDLGEYIIQESGDTPSHIIGPAIHKTREEVSDLFEERHKLPRKTDVARDDARGARDPAPALPDRRHGHHRRQLPGGRDRHHRDRDQRGQRPHDHHAAARARGHRRHREGAAHAGGRVLHPAPAHALGHRTVDQQLPHVHHRHRSFRATRTAPRSSTSSSSTPGARVCSARSCARPCAASAAAPA